MTDIIDVVKEGIIEEQIRWDARVNSNDVQVKEEDGHVTLQGTVPTYLDRIAATNAVWRLPGVRSVDNQLAVQYPPNFTLPDNDELHSDIEHIIRKHAVLDEKNIEIRVESGHVDLGGTVNKYWQKDLAEELVANVAGIVQITNRLAVTPQESAADEATAKDIVDALSRINAVDVNEVDVKVKDGHATLNGIVPNLEAYKRANDVAAFTFGVIDVENNLTIA